MYRSRYFPYGRIFYFLGKVSINKDVKRELGSDLEVKPSIKYNKLEFAY